MSSEKLDSVVLIEDDPADAELTMRAIASAKLPYRVRHFANGEAALVFLRSPASELPSLIILDLNLPGKDGKDVLRELKQSPALQSLKVVVFSTSSLPSDIEQVYRLGADAYVQKAADFRDFMARVVEILAA